jgi:hypothetical protein
MMINVPLNWEKIQINNIKSEEIIAYCETYIGKGNVVTYSYFGPGDIYSIEESCKDDDIFWILENDFNCKVIYFKNAQDALLFMLKWT